MPRRCPPQPSCAILASVISKQTSAMTRSPSALVVRFAEHFCLQAGIVSYFVAAEQFLDTICSIQSPTSSILFIYHLSMVRTVILSGFRKVTRLELFGKLEMSDDLSQFISSSPPLTNLSCAGTLWKTHGILTTPQKPLPCRLT